MDDARKDKVFTLTVYAQHVEESLALQRTDAGARHVHPAGESDYDNVWLLAVLALGIGL